LAAPVPWRRSTAAARERSCWSTVGEKPQRRSPPICVTARRTPKVDIIDGDYDARGGAGVVMITSGINEKTGGATDRSDPQGRLRLLDTTMRGTVSR